jgi:hypothetical protein
VNELIKAYTDELNSVYEQIDALWHKVDNHTDEDYYLSDEFNEQIKKLYNRKAALKATINDLK